MASSVIKNPNTPLLIYDGRCNDLNIDIAALFNSGKRVITQLYPYNASNKPSGGAGYYVLFIWDTVNRATQLAITQDVPGLKMRTYVDGNWDNWQTIL